MAEAVLLLGHGGPQSPSEVRPFVQSIGSGRVPDERLEVVVEQYRQIGGKSPFNQLTHEQAAALQQALAERGYAVAVAFATLHWQPTISDTVRALTQLGIDKIVCAILAPHRTSVSFDKYTHSMAQAIEAVELQLPLHPLTEYLRPWHDHPKFISAIADQISKSADQLIDSKTRVIFTAHSVPVTMSQASNYSGQVEETAKLVAQHLQLRDYDVCYQSRSGRPEDEWLEPDVVATINAAAGEGIKRVIVVPIGFVIDNAEVLYDLDIAAKKVADDFGLEMLRPATVGLHPLFIEMLCDLAIERMEAFYVAQRN